MARPLRVEFSGAWYHVMNRGAGRQDIFRADHQREYFLSLLAATAERFNAEWHAYCLMSNHYHLMIRTPDGNLQRIMRHVNGLYTQYYNRTERRDGPLFRGRYKAVLVDAEHYWLCLSRYIHRNPLEAGITECLETYRWSSYRPYIGRSPVGEWLTTSYVLNAIGKRNVRERYARYVAGDVDSELAEFYGSGRIAPILGDDEFKTRMLDGRSPDIDTPELKGARVKPSVDEIIDVTRRHFNVSVSEVMQSRRGRTSVSPARGVAMYLCQEIGMMTLAQIAETFDLASYASAGASIRQFNRKRQDNSALAKSVDILKLDLTP
ncbi:MAG TPA: transposase [Gammaproteobacteria bacterium]|nr:transposase [Gammaproteobacteria bacterium]